MYTEKLSILHKFKRNKQKKKKGRKQAALSRSHINCWLSYLVNGSKISQQPSIKIRIGIVLDRCWKSRPQSPSH